MALTVDMTQSGLAGLPDSPAASAALDTNTAALAAAVESVSGPRSDQRFSELWADQIDALTAYSTAVAADDTAARNAALDRLQGVAEQCASFLATSTEGRIGAPTLVSAFVQRAHLVGQNVGDHAQDYESSYAMSSDAYRQVSALAGERRPHVTRPSPAACRRVTRTPRTPRTAPRQTRGGTDMAPGQVAIAAAAVTRLCRGIPEKPIHQPRLLPGPWYGAAAGDVRRRHRPQNGTSP